MADERMKVNPDCWKRKHKKDKEPGQPGMPGHSSLQPGMIPFKVEQNNNSLTSTDTSILNNNNNNEEDYEGQPDLKKIKWVQSLFKVSDEKIGKLEEFTLIWTLVEVGRWKSMKTN